MLLSEALEALCMATKADGGSPATVATYRHKLRPLVNCLSGDVQVETITVGDLRRYVAGLWDEMTLYADHPYHVARVGTLSPFTVSGRVRALKRLFNWLESEGIIEINPVRKIKTPRPRCDEPKAASMVAFRALLRATEGGGLDDLRDRAILFLLGDTGCRVGGLCGLRVQDVDLDRGLVSLKEKGGKSRLMPVNPPTVDAVRGWLAVRPGDQGPALFVSLSTSKHGGLGPAGVGQMLKRRARRAGVAGPVNPHSWRHFFAKEYLLAGGDLATVSDLMGHSSIEVTKSSYAIFTLGELRAKHARYSPVVQMGGGGGVSDDCLPAPLPGKLQARAALPGVLQEPDCPPRSARQRERSALDGGGTGSRHSLDCVPDVGR